MHTHAVPVPPRGFSTLEMLIAMTVLILTFSAVTMLFPGIRSGSVDTELNAEGLNIAQKMLENQQALARKDFKLVVATTTQEVRGPITYQKAIAVQTKDLFTKQVTATVTWGAMYGRTQNVVLSTLVSNFQNVVGGDTCDSVFTGNWAAPQVTSRLLGQDILGDSSGLYPITDIDVFRKRLYVSVNTTPVTTSALNPGTLVNTTGVGTIAWSNPTNAQTSNSIYTTASLNGGQTTNYLQASNLGFSIPFGATILGIQVDVLRRGSSSSNTVRDSVVKIVKATGAQGSVNKADTVTAWPTSAAYKTYGSASDLWGETDWSPSAINSSSFGVVIVATAPSGGPSRTASIDHVRVTVTYTKQFYILNVTNPTSPAFVSGLGSNSVGTNFTSVSIATSTSSGDYAYVSLNSTATQVEVINVGVTPPTVAATYTIPSAGVAANTTFYKDGYLYVGLANSPGAQEFYVIDVHNPLAIPATPLGKFEVGAGVNAIYVKNGYAYLSTDDSARELIVLDLINLASPVLRGSYNAPPSGASTFGLGKSLYTIGDTLYFGRYYISTDPEFAVLDTSAAAPVFKGSFDTGPNSSNPFGIYGVIVGNGKISGVDRWLAMTLTSSQTNGGRFQVLNVDTPGSISSVSTVTLPNSGGGVALDCEWNDTNGKDYFYAASVPVSGSFTNKGSISIISAP